MEKNKAIEHLTNLYSSFEWFDHVDVDKRGRYVIYVKFMNLETMATIAELDGKQVLTEFANSKSDVVRAKYATPKTLSELNARPAPKEEVEEPFLEESDIDDLIFELDRLERLCGSKSLQDIFYEVHDGNNAVTDLSTKYPYVRSCMEKLYNNFGFDLIYEELDG